MKKKSVVIRQAQHMAVVKPPIAFDPVLTKQRFMAAIDAPPYVPTMFGGGRLERAT